MVVCSVVFVSALQLTGHCLMCIKSIVACKVSSHILSPGLCCNQCPSHFYGVYNENQFSKRLQCLFSELMLGSYELCVCS